MYKYLNKMIVLKGTIEKCIMEISEHYPGTIWKSLLQHWFANNSPGGCVQKSLISMNSHLWHSKVIQFPMKWTLVLWRSNRWPESPLRGWIHFPIGLVVMLLNILSKRCWSKVLQKIKVYIIIITLFTVSWTTYMPPDIIIVIHWHTFNNLTSC